MRLREKQSRRPVRRGVTAVEFAILLPFLAFAMVAAIDFARVFYFTQTLSNCARNGAYFASNYPGIYGYSTVQQAASEDATNLNPSPTYTTRYSSSSTGPFTSTSPVTTGYVEVTATWEFSLISKYPFPGLGNKITLSRSARMKMAPIIPNFGS